MIPKNINMTKDTKDRCIRIKKDEENDKTINKKEKARNRRK